MDQRFATSVAVLDGSSATLVAMSGLDNDLGSFICLASQRECNWDRRGVESNPHRVSVRRTSQFGLHHPGTLEYVVTVYLALHGREQIGRNVIA